MEKTYLEELILGLKESIERVKNGELESGDVIPEIKRIEGMCVFAHHFNLINAWEYSDYIDRLSDIEYSLDD